MSAVDDKPVLEVDSVEQWEAFLGGAPGLEGGPGPDGVRLRLRKKASMRPGITYPEALDSALCFGWVDGQLSSLDGDYHLQVFTPRRPRSPWSQRNRDHVARLTAAGRMRPAGLAEVERARADGRWDAAYRQKDAPVPPDLQTALDASAKAAAAFAGLSAQNRFAILFRVGNAKRATTREARIATFIAMLERDETLHPQRPRT